MTLITKSEFARRNGFSPQYVSELIRKGIIAEEKGGLLDSEKADYALSLKRMVSNRQIGKNKSKTELQELYIKVRLQNELEKGKILKLEAAEKEKSLISIEDVRRVVYERSRAVRNAILNVPDRVASLLASITDPVELHQILMKELRTALEELSRDEFR